MSGVELHELVTSGQHEGSWRRKADQFSRYVGLEHIEPGARSYDIANCAVEISLGEQGNVRLRDSGRDTYCLGS